LFAELFLKKQLIDEEGRTMGGLICTDAINKKTMLEGGQKF
jgi:hypothetical protein